MDKLDYYSVNMNKVNRESLISIFGEDILELYPEYGEEFDKNFDPKIRFKDKLNSDGELILSSSSEDKEDEGKPI